MDRERSRQGKRVHLYHSGSAGREYNSGRSSMKEKTVSETSVILAQVMTSSRTPIQRETFMAASL